MKNSVFVFALCLTLSFFAASAQHPISSGDDYLSDLYDRSIRFDTTQPTPVVVAIDSLSEWKKWRTVDNYHYGKNRGSLPMIADLDALHPYFREKVVRLIRACEEAGITLAVVETYRTPAKQAEYFAMGKKYTSTPGGKSRHQFGLAVDVVPMVDSVAVWNNHKLWRKIGIAGERLGLRWGGRWRVLYDPGHFEWSGGLSQYELAKGKLPKIPSSFIERYPSFEEELTRIHGYWLAWEVEQSVMANKGSGEPGLVGIGQ